MFSRFPTRDAFVWPVCCFWVRNVCFQSGLLSCRSWPRLIMSAMSCSLCYLQAFFEITYSSEQLCAHSVRWNIKRFLFQVDNGREHVSECLTWQNSGFNWKQNLPLSVLCNLFPIYKHKPKYNLLAIVLPSSDTFAAFLLFRLMSLFIFYFVWRHMITTYLSGHCNAFVFVDVTNITRHNDTYRS